MELKTYLKSLDAKYQAGDATEHTHRPALQALLEALAPDLLVINEPKRIAVGAPDLAIRKPLGKSQYLPIGYVETKDIGVDLNEVEKSEQMKRYLPLGNVLLTDYLEFRWYVDGKLRLKAALPPFRGGTKGGRLATEVERAVEELLRSFLQHEVLPITSPQELAKRMAALCRQIDRIIVTAFKEKQTSELLDGLKEAFERTLLPDLTPEQFADMFAQTLAYGLFAARINHFREQPGAEFRRSEAAREIPKTNPFLRRLFDTINGADIEDEPFIGFVDDLTAVMHHADIGAILQHFGRRTGQEDPVVHFYETFLAAYDPKLRELRGVYFTPVPVVSYIVRSVDILLKEKFGLKDGLADRSTVEVEVEENGQKVKKTLPKVLILDPACGTGTFLYAVIDLIRTRFMESGNAGEWSDFVREHLLPRIYGFELLMAPYAVAHLKLAMQLSGQDLDEPLRSQWAYDFESTERLNIFLTNSLEMTEKTVQMAMFGIEKQIAEEANAARSIKADLPIMVVLGNPPYSGHSANKNPWIEKLVRDYYVVDGEPLGERNPKWLQDDYVKFIRFGQWRIDRTGHGILAYISNHGYLDNPTFRGMRQNLMSTFDELYLLDLHGNAKKKETAPGGGKDENVFDIQQGVAIGVFVKGADLPDSGRVRRPASAAVGAHSRAPVKMNKGDAFGLRRSKYDWLFGHNIRSTEWRDPKPQKPNYLFIRQKANLRREYEHGISLPSSFLLSSLGIATARDKLAIGWNRAEIVNRVRDFASLDPEDARRKYDLGEDVRDWKVKLAQEDIAIHNAIEDFVEAILYRPFDLRYTYFTGQTRGFHCMPRSEVMQHMVTGRNLGLCASRGVEIMRQWDHVFCTNNLIQLHTVSLKEVNALYPLYLNPANKLGARRPNLAPEFVVEFSQKLRLKFVEDGRGDLKKTFGPEDVFDYIYAVFHSPTYRKRYAEFLKIDFPRVPLTSNVELFRKLIALGGQIVKLHLMEFDIQTPPNPPAGGGESESPSVYGGTEGGSHFSISYPVKGDHTVEKVRYVDKDRQVWINGKQYFAGVPPEVWEFHIGGYQVAEKWLKDRKGRTLSSEDREHYRKIIAALSETIVLMKEIDAAIPAWPLE